MKALHKYYPKHKIYLPKHIEHYLQTVEPNLLLSFNGEQLNFVREILQQVIPKPSPKIVDFRITIDLIVERFYVVLLVGKDKRKQPRKYNLTPTNKIANFILAILILIIINLSITLFIFAIIYLLKSAYGVNIFHDTLKETIQKNI
jgi:hypothetical protein